MITLKCILLTQYRLKLPFLSFIYGLTGGPQVTRPDGATLVAPHGMFDWSIDYVSNKIQSCTDAPVTV